MTTAGETPAVGEPMIQLDGLSKKFGDRLAVDTLTLEVGRGEIFGLLGHNGAGKSTAIGMILGQVWPTSGRALIQGLDVAHSRARALRQVGAIFESPAFYDYLSGHRNLEILSHYTAPTPPERIREVLDWVGLTGREQSVVRTYSHGMRARLALAQALLPKPEVLILDEPGDGLDPEGIHELRQMILRLRAELGLTILLSSHLLNEVQQLCTRIAVVRQGRKVFEGTVAEATRPRNRVRLRTGDFAKAVVFLTAHGLVVEASDGCWLTLAEGTRTDQVVKSLVEQNMPVFEIAPEEQTLEDFYLEIMRQDVGRQA